MTTASSDLGLPQPPYVRTGVAGWILALLAPIVLTSATFVWWGRAEQTVAEPPAELTNCRADLTRSRAEVVFIGNSKVNSDIDKKSLGAAFQARVSSVSAPGVGGAVFYAMLENCVLQATSPKLVVVYATAGAMLRRAGVDDRDRLGLEQYDAASLPGVQEKVLGSSSPFWGRVERRQRALHGGLAHFVRDGVAGLFFAPESPDGLFAAGRAWAEPALAAAIGADATTDAEPGRAIPVAERVVSSNVSAPSVDDSFVPDIIATAKAHGTRLLFISAPIAESKTGYDPVDAPLLRAFVERINAENIGYLDLSGERIPAPSFNDGVHLNPAGRALFTPMIIERLRGVDALGATPFSPAALPRTPPVVTRIGVPPTLPPLTPVRLRSACGWKAPLPELAGISDSALHKAGLGMSSPGIVSEDGKPMSAHARQPDVDNVCAGASNHNATFLKFSPSGGPAEVAATRTYTAALDTAVPNRDEAGTAVWWVYPGTALRLDFDEPCNPAAACSVAVTAHVAIAGNAPATLTVSDAPVVPFVVDGQVGVATSAATSDASWSIELSSPADGPWLLIKRVATGDLMKPWYALGKEEPTRTAALLGGSATYTNDASFSGYPAGPVQAGTGKMWVAREANALGVPNADAVQRIAGLYQCSPLRVAENGVPLPKPHTAVRVVQSEGGGTYQFKDFGIGFSTPDGTSPLDNGRAYTLFYEPTRACGTAQWMYPGDHARFLAGSELLTKNLSAGATRLDLTGAVFGEATGALALRLFLGEEPLLDVAVPLAGLSSKALGFDLPMPIPASAEQVVLELSTDAAGPFVLVTNALLVEPGRVVPAVE